MDTSPLINPWLIYFIGISPNISSFLLPFFIIGIIFGILSIIALFILHAVEADESVEGWNFTKWIQFTRNIFISCVFAVLLSGGLGALIPEQKWLIGIAVNSQITPKNLELVGGTAEKIHAQIKQDFLDIAGSFDKKEEIEKK